MRHFMSSTLEQRKDFQGTFSTHPLEVAWASEALFFITVEEIKGSGSLLNARVQISVDGVNWLDEGTAFEPISEKKQYFIKVRQFGGWLRLAGSIDGDQSGMNLTIHLVLKE